jgi:rare lipoprotein A
VIWRQVEKVRASAAGEAIPALVLFRYLLALVLAAGLASCAGTTPQPSPSPKQPTPPSNIRTQRPYKINGIWYYPLPTAEGYAEKGNASWYGPGFHSRPTANGEIYDMYAMTAAHKTLPIGTHVKVTNLRNNRSILVRVNDRGPFVSGRIIDLSRKAADELGMARTGVVPVYVEAVQLAKEETSGAKTYWVTETVPSFRYGRFGIQIGAFQQSQNAYRLADKMSSRYSDRKVAMGTEASITWYRVQVGGFRDIVLAKQEMERLRQQGYPDAFVVAMEE